MIWKSARIYNINEQKNGLLYDVYTWCSYEVPGMTLLRDLKRSMRLDRSKDKSVMFQLAPITISNHEPLLCGSCGADKTCVVLRLTAKMSDRFLEQRKGKVVPVLN
jgi:hypothetical protein